MKKFLLLSFAVASFSAQAQFWTPKATGFAAVSRAIAEISIVDNNVVWAKASDGSGAAAQVHEFTKSTDGGNTWTPGNITGIGLSSTLDIGSITAVSATTAWVSVNPSAATTSPVNAIYQTTNGGTTWNKQTSAAYTASSFANFVYFWDANNGVTMGDPTGGYFEIYTTSNGGSTWTRVPSANIPTPSPAGNEFGYTANYAVAGNTIWFGTSSGRLMRSTDMGLHWTASQTPVVDFGVAPGGNYSFSDNNKGILVQTDGALYSTTDAGVTWTPITPTGTVFVTDISYIPGTSKIVSTSAAPALPATGGVANGSGSSYSLDDGLTWTTIDVLQHTCVKFLNETTGFSGGFNTSSTVGGIYKYTGTELPTAHFQSSTLQVYPNPSTGIFNLTGTPVKQVTVFDISGKQVYNASFGSVTETSVDLGSLTNGMYMMNVTNEAGEVKTLKIAKN